MLCHRYQVACFMGSTLLWSDLDKLAFSFILRIFDERTEAESSKLFCKLISKIQFEIAAVANLYQEYSTFREKASKLEDWI